MTRLGIVRWPHDLYFGTRSLHDELARWLERRRQTTLASFPAINAWVCDEDMVLEAELPGVDPAQVEVSVTGDVVTVSGERTAPVLQAGEQYHRQERFSGRFSRTLQLPFRVAGEKVEAHYKKGVLTVRLPRAAEDRLRKIAVKTG